MITMVLMNISTAKVSNFPVMRTNGVIFFRFYAHCQIIFLHLQGKLHTNQV